MIRVLIIGSGTVTRLFYLPSLLTLEQLGFIKVVGVVDPDSEAATALTSQFKLGIYETDLSAAINETKPDLGIIASPPAFHKSQSQLLIENGIHLLCEKPMATSVEACRVMIETAEANNRILAVGHYKRFFPSHQMIKSLIDTQTFGRLNSIRIREGGKFDWPVKTDGFFKRDLTPGGVLLDIGVHALDLLLWWLGKPVHFDYQDDSDGGQEANCRLKADWEQGTHADIYFSRDWTTNNAYTFEFESATVVLKVNQSNELSLKIKDVALAMDSRLLNACDGTQAQTAKEAFTEQLRNVCNAIQNNTLPAVTGRDGLAAIEWIEACYANRQPMPEPWRTERNR